MMMMQKSNLRRLLLCLCCLFFLVLCALRFLAELVSVSESKSQESIVAEESQNKFRALASTLDFSAIDTSTASTGMTSRQEKSCSNFGYHSTYNAHNFSTITVIPEILSPAIASLQWIGSPPHRSLILLQYTTNESHVTKSNIFRSQVNGSMVNETCRFQPDSVIDSFFVSKNPNKVIFRDLINDRLYVTTDAGNNFDYSDQLQFTPDVIQFSDSHEDYLFAIDYSTNSLYVSTQLAISDSWKKLSTSVKAAYWTQLKDGQDFDDPTTIYFTELNTQSGKYKVKKAVFPYLNLSTCEFCQSIGEVTNFKLVHEYIFVIKNIDNGLTTLFVSYKRQSFIQARFIPAMGGNEQYSVVDASQGQVILAVLKDNTNADLYISDERGTNYSLSLQNIITNNFQWNSGIESFDFYLVKGTRGTYIANVAVINTQPFYQTTVISFNKGANWSPLTAPILDSDMLPVECYYPDCSLHLDMHNSGIASKESAVGMIVARGIKYHKIPITGTLGWNYSQGVGLYLSYDGGFSWRELFKANTTYLFDILDSGSTILVTLNTEYARQFMISYDTGFSWQHYNICTFGVTITGLHTEMGDTASLTTLYGSVSFPYASYVVLNLDMSQLNIVECKDDLDYIIWMPSDGRMGDRCVLGAKFRYRKRKLGHWCRNKPNYWIPSEATSCICTIEDFGCDIGFEHVDYNSPCTPVDSYPCVLIDYSFGYRRIPGDECVAKNNDYYFYELDLCSNGIFEFYVNATPSPAAVDQPITFIVTVNGRHQLEATYYFLYGDNLHDISTANIVKHSYNISGYFSVKVIVSTATGNSSTTIGVFVENEIVDANVHVLHFASNTYFFAVEIQCKSNKTDFDCRSIYYEWNFTSLYLGRLDGILTTSPFLNYTFLYNQSYLYDLWVYNAVSSVHKQGEFTAKDEKTIHAIISGPEFALVNSTVKFYGNVHLLMPNSIIYRWIVISHNDGTILKNFTGTDATIHVVFDRTGIYEITLEGLGSQNYIVIFNASSTIIIAAICNFQLIATPSIVAVNQTVVLSVTKVSNMENFIYLFLFGDKQPSVQTSNNSVVHSYTVAGSYQASVTMEDIGTSAHFETVIIVQDKIDKICVNTYVKSFTVTYVVIIDCGASSNHTYGTIQYLWDFNNGKNITTSLTTIITTYQFTGVYNFSLLASNNVSQKSYTGQIYIGTDPDTTNVQMIITGPKFTLVNVTVLFSISGKIPVIVNLMHNWTIIDEETNQVYVNKESNKLVMKFFKPGNYKVFASVNYNGSIFSSFHIISVESKLYHIKVNFPAVIEVAQQTAIFIHLYDIHGDSYKEYVTISITSDTQSIMLQYVKSPIIVKTYLSYSVIDIYTVIVTANNHVSEATTNFGVEVVRTNTTLLLEFSIVALSQANVSYETTSWRKQFSDVIDVSLTNENSLLDWQLIVTAGSVRNFLEIFVDILPMSSSLTALANATMIAEQLINVVNSNHTFSLPSSSSSISVSNAAIIGLQQELSENPTRGKSSKNDKNGTSLELGMGIGLGVPVLIVIVISILLGIIFYKRKIHSKKQYRKLGDSNRTSFSINDEADNGLDRTIDASMDETELEL